MKTEHTREELKEKARNIIQYSTTLTPAVRADILPVAQALLEAYEEIDGLRKSVRRAINLPAQEYDYQWRVDAKALLQGKES